MLTNKRIIILLSATLVGLIVLSLVGPLTKQRNNSIDAAIENDLSSISYLVSNYVTSKRMLPESLNDLELDDAVVARAEKYNYELDTTGSRSRYFLCADFRTDTRQGYDDMEVLYYSPQSSTNVRKHNSGRDCLAFQTFGTTYYNPYDYETQNLNPQSDTSLDIYEL